MVKYLNSVKNRLIVFCLVESYKANGGGSEIDYNDSMHLENHDYIIDGPSEQLVTRRRQFSNQPSLQYFDIDSLSQSSLSPVNSNASFRDSILRRLPSNISFSEQTRYHDNSNGVLQQLSDSEASSDENESHSDSEICSESTGGCGTGCGQCLWTSL